MVNIKIPGVKVGLDIYHEKLIVLERGEYLDICEKEVYERDMFTLDSLEILNFEKRAAYVFVDDVFLIFYICEDKKVRNILRKRMKQGYSDIPYRVFLTTNKHIDEQLAEYEIRYNILYKGRSRQKESIPLNDKQKISCWTAEYYGATKIFGVSGQEVGYQRRGMKRGFYDFYLNDTIYADLFHFEKLFDFVDPEYRENIENNFLRNYIEGESMLYISW